MKGYRKRTHKGIITEFAENLWAMTQCISDPKEREVRYDQMCNELITGGKGHPKRLLVDMVQNSPALLKLMSNSKEEMYKDYEQNMSWAEFLEIVKPLDDEPTAWRAE